ncbi:ABC transporter substrate-binding protein [Anaerocolumna sp. MB42-C2]|uniref:ABC transporter substrate-binding protein n=1 Tax=Anaerocolumna sp. MB42-C2 TaxID=3070997 RepID=UPI0027E108ED|nr:ABC transporter substrate-binding protein [Anaerocolumna sp. MB42-C2]WMJ85711.1 ABC transporter substrate-binding protein [Anaerocolumna sp. MB42-C2]
MKKVILTLLIFCMFSAYGCSSKRDVNDTEKVLMGRYVESQLSLPKGINPNDKLQLTKKDDKPFLYVLKAVNPRTITGYQMEKDGSWIEATPKWLKEIKINKNIYQFKIFDNLSGAQYLYYIEIINDCFKGNLFCSDDLKTCKTLKPEGWEDKTKDGFYDAPDNVCVLHDGTIAAIYHGRNIYFYNGKTMKKERSITGTVYSQNSLLSMDQSLIIGTIDESHKTTGVAIYDLDKDKQTNYPINSVLTGDSYIDTTSRKDLIMCNTNGVHVLKNGTSLWQTVMDGTMTSLALQTIWPVGFLATEAADYYILYNLDNSGYSLMKYTFDKTVAALPSIELKLYALTDNSTIRQAAALFGQIHPEVRVIITAEMTQEEYDSADSTIREDYVRALNTELLSGNGPDILMLTGLPADAFVEKGVLADISDIINPMLEKGELYPNIIDNYKKNNKFYFVPIRFALNLLCADQQEFKNLNSIAALADYNPVSKNKTLLGTMTVNDFISTFAPYFSGNIISSDNTIDKEKLVTLLNYLKKIADNSNLIDSYPPKGRGSNLWELASSIKANINQCSGFLDSIFTLGIVDYAKGSFTVFENSFTPLNEIGINNAGKNKDLCKEFITLLLSEEVQKYDLYDGFSINRKALLLASKNDRSNDSASSDIENEDGSYSSIVFNPPTKQQIDQLVHYCSTVSVKAESNEQLVKVFKEQTKDFFLGKLTADETADNIIHKLKTYLNE